MTSNTDSDDNFEKMTTFPLQFTESPMMTQYTFSEMAKSKLYRIEQAVAGDLRRRDTHNSTIITNREFNFTQTMFQIQNNLFFFRNTRPCTEYKYISYIYIDCSMIVWTIIFVRSHHFMMTSSKWKYFARPFVWGIRRSPANSPHKGQWCGALMFSLICT